MALKAHFLRMHTREAIVKRLNEANLATKVDILNAQYETLEANRWLEEEAAK